MQCAVQGVKSGVVERFYFHLFDMICKIHLGLCFLGLIP